MILHHRMKGIPVSGTWSFLEKERRYRCTSPRQGQDRVPLPDRTLNPPTKHAMHKVCHGQYASCGYMGGFVFVRLMSHSSQKPLQLQQKKFEFA